MDPPKGLDMEDGKLEYCLACHNQLCFALGTDVIVCDHCPVAYHPQCAGYASLEEVPEGRWPCWNCSRDGQDFLFPTAKFQAKVGARVMVGYAEPGSKAFVIFYEARVAKLTGTAMEVEYTKYKGANEVLSLRSPRIWHGTLERRAWTTDPTATHWQPLSRQESEHPEVKAAREYWQWLQAQRVQQAREQQKVRPGSGKASPRASTATAAASAQRGTRSMSPRMQRAERRQQAEQPEGKGGGDEEAGGAGQRAAGGSKATSLVKSNPSKGQLLSSGGSGGRGKCGQQRGVRWDGRMRGGSVRGHRSHSGSATSEPSQLVTAKQLKRQDGAAATSGAPSGGGAAAGKVGGAAKGGSPTAAPPATSPSGKHAARAAGIAACEFPAATDGAARKRVAGDAAAAEPLLACGGKDAKRAKQGAECASPSATAADGAPGDAKAAAAADGKASAAAPSGAQGQECKGSGMAAADATETAGAEPAEAGGSGMAAAASGQAGGECQVGQKRPRGQGEGGSGEASPSGVGAPGRKRSRDEEGSRGPAPATEAAAADATTLAVSAPARRAGGQQAEAVAEPAALGGDQALGAGTEAGAGQGEAEQPAAAQAAEAGAPPGEQLPELGQAAPAQQKAGTAAVCMGSEAVAAAAPPVQAPEAAAPEAAAPGAAGPGRGGSSSRAKRLLASLMPPIPPPASQAEVPMLGWGTGGRGRGRGRPPTLGGRGRGLGSGEAATLVEPKQQGKSAAATAKGGAPAVVPTAWPATVPARAPAAAPAAVGQALLTRQQGPSATPVAAPGQGAAAAPTAGAPASAGTAGGEAAAKSPRAKRSLLQGADAGGHAAAPAETLRSLLKKGAQQAMLAQQLNEAAAEAVRLGEQKWRAGGEAGAMRALYSVPELLRGMAKGEVPANAVVRDPDLPPGSASGGESARGVVGAWVGKVCKAQQLHAELGKLRQSMAQRSGQQRSESPSSAATASAGATGAEAAPALGTAAAAGQEAASSRRRRLEGVKGSIGTPSFGVASRQGVAALGGRLQPAAATAPLQVPLVQSSAVPAPAAYSAATIPVPRLGQPAPFLLAQPLGMTMNTCVTPMFMCPVSMQPTSSTAAPQGAAPRLEALPPNVQAAWQALATSGAAAPGPPGKEVQPPQQPTVPVQQQAAAPPRGAVAIAQAKPRGADLLQPQQGQQQGQQQPSRKKQQEQVSPKEQQGTAAAPATTVPAAVPPGAAGPAALAEEEETAAPGAMPGKEDSAAPTAPTGREGETASEEAPVGSEEGHNEGSASAGAKRGGTLPAAPAPATIEEAAPAAEGLQQNRVAAAGSAAAPALQAPAAAEVAREAAVAPPAESEGATVEDGEIEGGTVSAAASLEPPPLSPVADSAPAARAGPLAAPPAAAAAATPQGEPCHGTAAAAAAPQGAAVGASSRRGMAAVGRDSPRDVAAAGVAAVLGCPFYVGEEVEAMPGDCMGGWYSAKVEQVAVASHSEGGWRLLLDIEVPGPSREPRRRKAWVPWMQGSLLRIRPVPHAVPARDHMWAVGDEVEVKAQLGWWPAVVHYSDVNAVEVEYAHPPPSIKDKARKLWPVHRDNVRERTTIPPETQCILAVAAQYAAAAAAVGVVQSLPIAGPATVGAGRVAGGAVLGTTRGRKPGAAPQQVQQVKVHGMGSVGAPAAVAPAAAVTASGQHVLEEPSVVGMPMPALLSQAAQLAGQADAGQLRPGGTKAQQALKQLHKQERQWVHSSGSPLHAHQLAAMALKTHAATQQQAQQQQVAAAVESPRSVAAAAQLGTALQPPRLAFAGPGRERRGQRQLGPSRLGALGALKQAPGSAVDERVRQLQALPPLQGSSTLRALLRQAQRHTQLGA